MKQFEINVKDEVGALEKIAEALATRGINIISISSERVPGKNAAIKIVTNDDDKTRDIMNEERFVYRESDFITLRLVDQPGELLRVTRLLSSAEINIESLYVLNRKEGSTSVAIVVNKMEEAKEVLKNL
ncbi:MAG: ACT domain-containing protein [Thermoplasmata archaeon]|nr:MAG: ACT domain-containing protein [Thermoplasmata archaeon]